MPNARKRCASGVPIALVAMIATLGPANEARAELGDGIAMGPGRLKLGVDLNLRYDTAGGTAVSANGATEGDLIGLAQGKFKLNIRTDSVSVDFTGAINWNQYFGVNDRPGQGAPSTELSFVGAFAKGDVEFNRNREFGVQFRENLLRTDMGVNPIFGLAVLTLDNLTSARLRYTPNMGQWEFGLTGDFSADAYEAQFPSSAPVAVSQACISEAACTPSALPLFNSLAVHGALDAAWHVLPRLALSVDAGAGYQEYPNYSVANVNALPVKAEIGLGTVPLSRLSLVAKVGYGGVFLADKASLSTVTGLLDLGYGFTSLFYAHVGASRTVTPVGGATGFFLDDHFFVTGSLKATSRLFFNLLGTADLFDSPAADGHPASSVQAFGANLTGEWAVSAWLSVVAGALFSARADTSGAVGSVASLQSYNRFIGNAGVTTYF